MMREFTIVIEQAGHNFSAYAPEVPGCVATGSTVEEAESNMRGALELHLRGMQEDGLAPESPDITVRRVRIASRPAVAK
jgi:predicted RNase H-like HicB family nuclease